MKKLITTILFMLVLVLLVSCNSSNGTTEHVGNDGVNDGITNTNNDGAVTEEHINFILNRRVFVPGFSDLYKSAIPNYDSVLDYEMTFADLFNSKYFAENLCKWEYLSTEKGIYIVSFSGMAKTIGGDNIPIVAAFSFTDKAEMPVIFRYVFGYDTNGNLNDWSFTRIAKEYSCDETTAICMCDATFSCMLVSALVEIKPHPSNEELIYNEGVIAEEKGEYLLAIEKYSAVNLYKDAKDRIVNCKYLYAESAYTNGNYITAINYYQEIVSYNDAAEKIKSSYFLLGNYYLSNEEYLEAADCFEKASTYTGAIEKFKESCYLYADQQLLVGNLDVASNYFTKAGDYNDASTKMLQYYYEHGNDSLTSKQYLSAIDFFKKCIGYLDSDVKYKEANYLYGEELLSNNSVESAKSYFYEAQGYKDADTRIQRYYYEGGTQLLNSGEYLNAAEKFILAGVYSDAKTMEKECYYQYAKKQMQLNYISKATECFSKCRGYKDTDDILLGYYYTEASKSVTTLLNKFSANSFTLEVDEAYNDAKEKLILCEGYQDSTALLVIINKLYFVWGKMDDVSKYEASLYNMVATYSGDIITITKENFMSGTSCSLSMVHNVQNDTFSANITHMFNLSAREYDVRNVILAMIILFTDIEDTSDLDAAVSNKNNWMITGDKETFNMSYGGYVISIKTKPESYGYIDCEIAVTK